MFDEKAMNECGFVWCLCWAKVAVTAEEEEWDVVVRIFVYNDKKYAG